MKPKSACDTCRDRRRKCIRSQQGLTCDFCAERKLPCNLSRETVYQATGYEPIVPWRSHALTHKCRLLPPTDLCLEAIRLYFRYVHVSFHLLFHQPSFLRAFADGSLPKILLFAVMGMAVRFARHDSQARIPPKKRGRPFTREAERLLDLHDVSLTTIQACMLLGASAVVEGESATESVYFSIACRMAVLLDLPNAKAATQIEQEVHRRVWWSVYETDTWSSTAVRLPKMMPLRDVPFPLAEDAFLALPLTLPAEPGPPVPPSQPQQPQQGSPGQPPPPPPPSPAASPDSLLAQAFKIGLSLSKIDRLNALAAAGTTHYVDLIPQVEAVHRELQAWQAALPATMANTPDNLRYWTGRDQGHVFVFVHMNHLHLCQLLFYQFIHHSTHDAACPPRAARFAALCRDASSRLCELLHRAPAAELLNSLVGHILAIASTVQLHALLFGEDEAATAAARRRLERNFELLKRLETYWPCVDVSFARLEAFHDACLRFQDGSQFRMDRWMLTFLLEFATAISDTRTADGGNANGGNADGGAAPQSWRNIIRG